MKKINLDVINNQSIEQINKQLPKNKKILDNNNFEILGTKSSFDSMVLINFVLIIEEKLLKISSKNFNLLNFLTDKMNSVKKYSIKDFKKDIIKKFNEKKSKINF